MDFNLEKYSFQLDKPHVNFVCKHPERDEEIIGKIYSNDSMQVVLALYQNRVVYERFFPYSYNHAGATFITPKINDVVTPVFVYSMRTKPYHHSMIHFVDLFSHSEFTYKLPPYRDYIIFSNDSGDKAYLMIDTNHHQSLFDLEGNYCSAVTVDIFGNFEDVPFHKKNEDPHVQVD